MRICVLPVLHNVHVKSGQHNYSSLKVAFAGAWGSKGTISSQKEEEGLRLQLQDHEPKQQQRQQQEQQQQGWTEQLRDKAKQQQIWVSWNPAAASLSYTNTEGARAPEDRHHFSADHDMQMRRLLSQGNCTEIGYYHSFPLAPRSIKKSWIAPLCPL